MKPPHFLCKNCGIIITDQGHEPKKCIYCGGSGFYDIGYEGDYDPDKIRKQYHVNVRKDCWKDPKFI